MLQSDNVSNYQNLWALNKHVSNFVARNNLLNVARSIELQIKQNGRKCSHMQKFFLLVYSQHRHWGKCASTVYVRPATQNRRCASGKRPATPASASLWWKTVRMSFTAFSSQTNLWHRRRAVPSHPSHVVCLVCSEFSTRLVRYDATQKQVHAVL